MDQFSGGMSIIKKTNDNWALLCNDWKLQLVSFHTDFSDHPQHKLGHAREKTFKRLYIVDIRSFISVVLYTGAAGIVVKGAGNIIPWVFPAAFGSYRMD